MSAEGFNERSVAGSMAIWAAIWRAVASPNAALQREYSQGGASRVGSSPGGPSRSRPRSTALTKPLNGRLALLAPASSTEVATAAKAGTSR